MAQFTVRNLEDDVKKRLQARAALNGVSMEEEVRRLLRQAVMLREPQLATGVGTRMASRFGRQGLRGEEAIAELKGAKVQAAVFNAR